MSTSTTEGLAPLTCAAVAAAQPRGTVGQDAALQEGVELVLHELRQIGPIDREAALDASRRADRARGA
jgi:hypothetical protein